MVRRKALTDALDCSGRVGTACARLAREEHGQALPLLLMVMVFFVAAGVLFYQLALSTNYATVAQTAADAAALAAEQNVVQQEQSAPGFLVSPGCPSGPPDPNAAWQAASRYAQDDGATVVSVQYAPSNAGYGCDAIVLVKTNQGLPATSVQASKQAVAEARASTDPLSASSASIPISNDASTATGPRFVGPHGGKYGFFPSANANFSQGSEPEIAGRLDQLGIKQRLHIVGIAGYAVSSAAAGAGTTYAGTSVGAAGAGVAPTMGAAGASLSAGGTGLQACGAAALVSGLGPAVSSQQVTSAGLALLSAAQGGQPQEVGLSGTTASACDQGTAPTPSPLTAGNADVHLVSLNGGPKGSVLAWPGLGLSPLAGPWVIPTPVVMCESSGINQPPNWATASGYYQITLPTWQDFGGTAYAPSAWQAPKPIQDLIALRIWNSPNGPARWDCARKLGFAA